MAHSTEFEEACRQTREQLEKWCDIYNPQGLPPEILGRIIGWEYRKSEPERGRKTVAGKTGIKTTLWYSMHRDRLSTPVKSQMSLRQPAPRKQYASSGILMQKNNRKYKVCEERISGYAEKKNAT